LLRIAKPWVLPTAAAAGTRSATAPTLPELSLPDCLSLQATSNIAAANIVTALMKAR
jgi:hypothetical protein